MFHIPDEFNVQTFYFPPNGNSWTAWNVPRGVAMIQMVLIGSGGGGGAGRTSASADRGGGGGGGSSAITTLTIPAELLPETLYIRVPIGTTGGGSHTVVSVYPDDSSNVYTVLRSGGTVAAGSGGNGISAGGGAGNAGNAFTQTRYAALGVFTATAGMAGGTGSLSTPTDLTPNNFPLTGGAGGAGVLAAGTNAPGGAIAESGYLPAIPGGAAAADGNPGAGGLHFPFGATGGSGGGSNVGGTAGNGGRGGIGSGGGGSGGGIVGGAEGRGGNGAAWLTVW